MAFVNGYLSIIAQQTGIIINQSAIHWQELMADGKIFGWLLVQAYHAAWIHNLEQGTLGQMNASSSSSGYL